MSALEDLIQEITDEDLRRRIEKEVATLKGTKKFGLVFEPQNPECTPLYDVPIKKKSRVARKAGKLDELYHVANIVGEEVFCIRDIDGKEMTFNKDELISVAQFGDPIYPYLQPLDTVCNAPDSSLWHALIEADNYHALQLLKYLYGGKVDCIYIDPPYNTGARDWKYNNDYVDASNEYRHSKWLSMMEKRLKLAKELLNPRDSVLIVTIDEHEYLHLGCLLEEIFRGARIQMVTSMTNKKGQPRAGIFSRCEEYLFVVFVGAAKITRTADNMLFASETTSTPATVKPTIWNSLLRRGTGADRKDSPTLFYPIFIDESRGKIIAVGEPLGKDTDRLTVASPDRKFVNFPMHKNGSEGRWQMKPETLRRMILNGTAKLGQRDRTTGMYAILYLKRKQLEQLATGEILCDGKDDNGALILHYRNDEVKSQAALQEPRTLWVRDSHDASVYGSTLLSKVIGGGKFSFPKSLYAVRDALNFFVANKPDALIVDFFAGSGTTLHAVNLLNAEDGGNRRCILVTNNEVSDAEEKSLRKKGFTPADDAWQKLGVARYVTWQRTVCSIEGHDINGAPLSGNYLGSDLPMADGFKANAAFFKLGFLDKDYVALGRQFKELLPVLWFKAGCRDKCPTVDEKNLPEMMILPKNNFAVLIDERYFSDFEREVLAQQDIDMIFIITDSDYGYHANGDLKICRRVSVFIVGII